MKAIVFEKYGSSDVLTLKELPTPAPGEGEVLVRIRAAGVNPVDWKIREGRLKGFLPATFPAIPGWDLAGEVEGLGHASRRFQVGDAVWAYARRPVVSQGTYAEYTVIPEAYLALKPSRLSFREAASVPLAGLTAWQSLFDAAQLKSGERILVLGASGGVGSFAVQMARAIDCQVAAVSSQKNHDYLTSLGAKTNVDYRTADWPEAVLAATGGGVDVVYDCIGGQTLKASIPVLREGGRVVSICDSSVQAMFSSRKAKGAYVFVEPNSRQLDQISQLVEAGKLSVTLSQVFPLEQAREAQEASQSGHTQGKIVLAM